QDRGRRQVQADPHRARCRVRAARGMSFRTRIALVAAAAVRTPLLAASRPRAGGLAGVAASVTVFVVVHNELYGQVDRALHDRAVEVASGPRGIDEGYLRVQGPRPGVQSDFVQAVPIKAPPYIQLGARVLPVNHRDREAAQGGGGIYYSVKHVGDTDYRVLTIPSSGLALQVYRPLTEVNRTLHRITFLLIVIALGGMGVAAALGLLVARSALRPVRQLTRT